MANGNAAITFLFSIPFLLAFVSLLVHMDVWEVLVCVPSCLLGQRPARLIH